MTHIAATERAELAATLLSAGPAAPTLCGQWGTHDLVAHLVIRENRPDTAAGLVLAPLSGYTRKVQAQYRERAYGDLVAQFAAGPPKFSPFRISRIDDAANLVEFFVHGEDVRRAQAGWEPRELSDSHQEALWRALQRMARILLRQAKVPVRLVRPDGAEIAVGPAGYPVRVLGEPAELLLYCCDRCQVANIQLQGNAESIEKLATAPKGL